MGSVKLPFPQVKRTTNIWLQWEWTQSAVTPGWNDSAVDTGFYRLWLRSALMETWHPGVESDVGAAPFPARRYYEHWPFWVSSHERLCTCSFFTLLAFRFPVHHTLAGGKKANSSTGNGKEVKHLFIENLPRFKEPAYTCKFWSNILMHFPLSLFLQMSQVIAQTTTNGPRVIPLLLFFLDPTQSQVYWQLAHSEDSLHTWLSCYSLRVADRGQVREPCG